MVGFTTYNYSWKRKQIWYSTKDKKIGLINQPAFHMNCVFYLQTNHDDHGSQHLSTSVQSSSVSMLPIYHDICAIFPGIYLEGQGLGDQLR